MSATDTETARPSLPYAVAQHVYVSVVYTPVYLVGVAVLTAPFAAYVLTRPETVVARYLSLGYAGWALYMGQFDAVGATESRHDPARSRFTDLLFGVVSLVYFNLVVALAAVAGVAAWSAGLSSLAAVAAFLLIPVDSEASRQYGVGLLAASGAVVVRLGDRMAGTGVASRVERLVERVETFLSTAGDAVPPVMRNVSVRSFMREDLRR